MGWPQYTLGALMVLDLGFVIGMHGKPKGDYNFFITAFCIALNAWLLYEGGFWRAHA